MRYFNSNLWTQTASGLSGFGFNCMASPPILVSPISNFVLFDLPTSMLKFALLLLTIRSLITTVAAASGAAEFCTTAYLAYITLFIVVDILVIRILFIWLSFIDL